MARDAWFVGDLHLGHKGIITFTDSEGKPVRDFATMEEHDDTLINNINKCVKPNDRLYFLGDVVINRRALPMISRINGKKKLIKGNHDIFKLKDYLPYFYDIAAYKMYPKEGIICSHIPIHTSQLEYRFKWNVHGHLHSNFVMKRRNYKEVEDKRYINICPEKTNHMPISYEQILDVINKRKSLTEQERKGTDNE